jgi:hypothetical protein
LPVATHGTPLGQLGQQPVAAAVGAPVGPLQLHAEAVGAEGGPEAAPEQRGLAVLARLDAPCQHAVARAARQAHEALRVALDLLQRQLGLALDRILARPAVLVRLVPAEAHPAARVRVGLRDQPAEVRVAGAALAQEREVRAVVERQLGARDRPDPKRLERLSGLHGAVQPVVVGHGQRRVALLRGRARQLHRV